MPKQVYDIIIVNKHINKHKKKLVKLTGLLSLSSWPSLFKAFYSINHNLLLAKLSAYGVTEDALQLLRSYLTDRKQHVKIDGNLSDWQIMKCGVPQGSILGPLLFNIYMNDANFSDISCSLRGESGWNFELNYELGNFFVLFVFRQKNYST